MTALLYALGVLAFTLVIAASIGLHEIGHMVPAKRFGGKVTHYFIGFGPTLWSKQVGETEYGLKAIPLGGYVKIVGMLPPGATAPEGGTLERDADGNEVLTVRRSSTGLFTQLVSDARAAEWEQIKPEDSERLFYRMAWWKKVVVMAGGPAMNLLIAFGVFWLLFATFGQVVRVDVEPRVSEVLSCVVPAAEDGRACTADEIRDNPTPAYAAGLRAGDEFVTFNGTEITGWEQLQAMIRGNGDKPATFGIRRDGRLLELDIATTVQARPSLDDPSSGKLVEVGFLGVVPDATEVVEHGGPIYTLQQMGHMTVDVAKTLGQLPVKVWGVAKAVVGLEERAPDSPVSVVGGGRLAGEAVSSDLLTATEALQLLLVLAGGFNLFIGMFNLLPLLPLDGGHIAGALYEAARRGIARLLRRPDPGYVDVAKMLPVAYVMASLFLVMGVVLILGDIVAPVHLLS